MQKKPTSFPLDSALDLQYSSVQAHEGDPSLSRFASSLPDILTPTSLCRECDNNALNIELLKLSWNKCAKKFCTLISLRLFLVSPALDFKYPPALYLLKN